MLVNKQTIGGLFINGQVLYKKEFESVKTLYPQISTIIPSSTSETNYAWLSGFPSLREWVGERIVKNISAYSYNIKNRKFESTIKIKRDDIADDQIGLYAAFFQEMGGAAARHPDELLFELIKSGFVARCYDGKPFFSEQHPVMNGVEESKASNVQLPVSSEDEMPAWYLLDNSRAVKPFIFQVREKYELARVNEIDDYNTFMRDEFIFGVRARGNMGFSFWQLAFASKLALTPTNFAELYDRMSSQKTEEERPLAIQPKILLVGQSNREAAFYIAKAETLDNQKPNPNYGLVEVVVSPHLP
ncbi:MULTISPECIES: Mu-like prophage major head subunit gpT family protein [Serratia]|uniref:Mu-like prophage major head subunit gpT family protein n=1 Tax=Serratia TaxID=613 RepID=UPI00141C8321|nr:MULTISPECIES: Mu-like prophage major head subunit gpT family protein [Serratia]MBP1130285.1 phage major head subunit gpT-like protein [Serratia sp. PL17]CAB1225304.1 Mu-like prophage major head subunit gpT [Serratia marcescens]